jgi:hypothetical protein
VKIRADLDDVQFVEVQDRVAVTEFPKTEEELAQRLGVEPEAEVEVEEQVGLAAEAEEPAVEQLGAEEAEPAEELAEQIEVAEPIQALYEEPPEDILLDTPEPEPEPEPEPAPVGEVGTEQPARKVPIIAPARREEDEELPVKKKKGKDRRRTVVYDEDLDEMVSRRKPRRGGRSEWDEYLD